MSWRSTSATSTSRSIGRSKTPARSTRRATRSTSSRTRVRGSTAIAHPGVALPQAVRDYDGRRVRGRKALCRQLVPPQQLPVEPAARQLLGPLAVGRKRAHQPERRPAVGLPDDDVQGRRRGATSVRWRPIVRISSRRSSSTSSTSARASAFNQFVASGLPVTRLVGIYPPNNLPVQYLGRDSDGRTPTFSQTDVCVQHDSARRCQVSLNVLNLFNQDTATSGSRSTRTPTA